jgi:hypothetical protein
MGRGRMRRRKSGEEVEDRGEEGEEREKRS